MLPGFRFRLSTVKPLALLALWLVGCSSQPKHVDPGANPTNDAAAPDPLASKIEAFMTELVGAGFSGAVLVAQRGEVVFEQGYGLADDAPDTPNTAETVFDSGSLSKQFTAAAIIALEEAGELRVDDPLSRFFADVPSDKADITLHELLTHSSGLPDNVYAGDFEQASADEARRLAFDAEFVSPPGSAYLYSDTGYGVLALVIEKVSGRPFQTFLRTRLFERAGMTHTGFYNEPRWEELSVAHGYLNGHDLGSAATRPGPYWGLLGFGGVLTTVGDLFRWSEALRSATVLGKASGDKLLTPYIAEDDEEGGSAYAYGWVVSTLPREATVVWHDGATDSHNAMMSMISDAPNTMVAVLSNRIEEIVDGGEVVGETLYAIETGVGLVNNLLLADDWSELPPFAASEGASADTGP